MFSQQDLSKLKQWSMDLGDIGRRIDELSINTTDIDQKMAILRTLNKLGDAILNLQALTARVEHD